jgi:hypothetical protein
MLDVVDQNGTANRLELDILRTRSELQRRFGSGSGCAARAADFARLLPNVPSETVEEALHRLADEGVVGMHCLSDGALAFHFPAA